MSNRLSDEYDEDEALDEVESDAEAEGEETDIGVEAVEVESDGETPAAKLKKDEIAEAESLSVTAKENQRRELEEQLKRFLSQGGTITEVPPDAHQ